MNSFTVKIKHVLFVHLSFFVNLQSTPVVKSSNDLYCTRLHLEARKPSGIIKNFTAKKIPPLCKYPNFYQNLMVEMRKNTQRCA